jgi:Mg-chelatase subunit ChlD
MTAQNFMVVLDGSGSMGTSGCSGRHSKIDAAKTALDNFAHSVPEEANLGLVVFDSQGVGLTVPLVRADKKRFSDNVAKIHPSGGTPLHSAIKLAYEKLTDQARAQLGYGEYHLVVVTDGEASGGESPKNIVRRILEDSPVTIHTIGFCIDTDHSLNQPGYVLYRTANDLASLKEGLQRVLAEAPAFTVSDFK